MSIKSGARWRVTYLASVSVLVLSVCAGASGVGAASAAAAETPGETFAASVTPAGDLAETGVGQEVTISADGRLVAFLSHSPELSPEATPWAQAYVKDLDSGDLVLASRADGADGEPADEPGSSFGVERPFLSEDGRYLAFETAAGNLVADFPAPAGGPVTHVYRRDLESGETEIVDRADGAGGEAPPTAARLLAISGDGRLVAFSDQAAGLADPPAAPAGEETIYVRDLEAGTTIEVAAEGAEEAAFSRDGRYLLFTSPATALDPEANGVYQVYRRDLGSGETVLVSRGNPTGGAPQGEPADGEAYEAVFVGASDCRVAFFAEGTSVLTAGGEDPAQGIYLRDFCDSTPATRLLSVDGEGEPFGEVSSPSATDEGLVAFGASAIPGPLHLYLADPGSAELTLLDRASGAEGEPAQFGAAGGGMVAASGCRAVFASESSNLLPDEPSLSGRVQAFVRQLSACQSEPSPTDPEDPPVTEVPRVVEMTQPVSAGSPAPVVGASVPTGATKVALSRLWRRSLWLSFDGAGRAMVRIQKQTAGRRWRLVKRLTVVASERGEVKAPLPALPNGRYRLRIRLLGDHGHRTATWYLHIGPPDGRR